MPDDVRNIDVNFGNSSQNLFRSEGVVRVVVETLQALASMGTYRLYVAAPMLRQATLRGQLTMLLGKEGDSWRLSAPGTPPRDGSIQLSIEADDVHAPANASNETLRIRSWGALESGGSMPAAQIRVASAAHDVEDGKGVVVVKNTASDLAPLIGLSKERRQTPESLRRAAGLIRYYASMSGQSYLGTFPFEEAEFIVATGEDAPLANLVRAGEMTARLVRQDRRNVKLFTLASSQALEHRVQDEGLARDVISIPSPPPEVRAALLHCATAAIHPAFHEATYGPFGFFDAASVGTPCLIADGPHVRELLNDEPSLNDLAFAPYRIDQMQQLYAAITRDRDRYVNLATTCHRRILRRRSSARVAQAIIQVAQRTPNRK